MIDKHQKYKALEAQARQELQAEPRKGFILGSEIADRLTCLVSEQNDIELDTLHALYEAHRLASDARRDTDAAITRWWVTRRALAAAGGFVGELSDPW